MSQKESIATEEKVADRALFDYNSPAGLLSNYNIRISSNETIVQQLRSNLFIHVTLIRISLKYNLLFPNDFILINTTYNVLVSLARKLIFF